MSVDMRRVRRQAWLAWCILASTAATLGGIIGWVTREAD